jgi:NADPH:quinone reductase-like Zn-dependent oxidoreductase
MSGWQLRIDRTDPGRTSLSDAEVPEPAAGQVVLRTSLVAVTANTTAYAELGESLRYWDFFPIDDRDWGVSPMWGFADVVASAADGVEIGTRVYGFVPSASHAVVTPKVVADGRFRDIGGVRGELPPSYSNYLATTHDRGFFPPEREDLQVVFRPLFITSWALADWLGESRALGVDRVLISSASSKTAYGAALLLAEAAHRPRTIGLTSATNRDYVSALRVYDEVICYDDIDALTPVGTSLYVDLAGSAELRATLRAGLGSTLVREVVVGLTHHEGLPAAGAAAAPEFWFAPDHLKKRGKDWGPGVLHTRFSDDYRAALPTLAQSVRLHHISGPESLQQAWHAVLDNTTAAGVTPVVEL